MKIEKKMKFKYQSKEWFLGELLELSDAPEAEDIKIRFRKLNTNNYEYETVVKTVKSKIKDIATHNGFEILFIDEVQHGDNG